MKPVYWKPRYPTRRMHERAAANRQLAREQALRHERPDSLLRRFLRRLRGE
jgi:hypothetical protein